VHSDPESWPFAGSELLRHAISYFPDDLVVLTWDRALIVAPSAEMDGAEVTALAETADNALRVTGDVNLARIYGAATDVFRVPLVSAWSERTLSIIRDSYTALYNDAASSRAAIPEAAIVLLLLVEALIALLVRG
jgi:hypothetical protein